VSHSLIDFTTQIERGIDGRRLAAGVWPPPRLKIRGLTLRFGAQTLFEALDLDLQAGRLTALLGESGVGKSTLLRVLAGLEYPHAGEVTSDDGRPISDRVAFMGQQDLLLPWLSALANVSVGARLRGDRPNRARAMSLLARVGLADSADALPEHLSGGMRQRVALARTLYEDRPIVLMDEPFSALDALTRARIQSLAAELLAGRTVLFITHDPLEACRLADTLLVLHGSPARLAAPITLAGATPRAVDDPDVLATQGRLLRLLLAGAA
jgi:putative hydroxymethylpyrimidine transport system ATP-binding protein